MKNKGDLERERDELKAEIDNNNNKVQVLERTIEHLKKTIDEKVINSLFAYLNFAKDNSMHLLIIFQLPSCECHPWLTCTFQYWRSKSYGRYSFKGLQTKSAVQLGFWCNFWQLMQKVNFLQLNSPWIHFYSRVPENETAFSLYMTCELQSSFFFYDHYIYCLFE